MTASLATALQLWTVRRAAAAVPLAEQGRFVDIVEAILPRDREISHAELVMCIERARTLVGSPMNVHSDRIQADRT